MLQWARTGGENQRWYFERNGDGTVSIVSKLSGMYLTVASGVVSDGAALCVDERREGALSAGQRFTLEEWSVPASERVVDDGVYTLAVQSDPSYGISAGGLFAVASSLDGDLSESFYVYWSDGYYEIQNVTSRKLLDVEGALRRTGLVLPNGTVRARRTRNG